MVERVELTEKVELSVERRNSWEALLTLSRFKWTFVIENSFLFKFLPMRYFMSS